ncbi:MAG TPA: serine/threonine protein kinase [Thioploca sp.]|nr:serine/threonine protein kinase [Thioploca sp.]
MMVETPELKTLCISCLQYKGHRSLCLQCGYDERKYKEHPLYLKPRTLLKNQYVIGIPLGQGGFGITYIGQDLWLQKKVAIKEYLPAALATRDVFTSTIIPLKKQENTFNKGLQFFIDEARNLAKFDHPNIVRVINFFEENQTGYMVMDYLEGLSPVDILTQAGGRLPVDEALAIILPILDALAEVHAQHIYHRDISLQNIRILKSGVPILVDFGAARHIVGEQSCTLDLVLKHGYSPLEQYSGKGKMGPWTDIYAGGASLYLLITGTLPPAATDRFCEDSLIAPTSLCVEIGTIVNDAIMRALAIKFEERFQTVQEFKAALLGSEAALLPSTLSALPPVPTQSRPQYDRRKGKRKTVAMIAASVLFLLMLSGGLLFSFQQQNAHPVKLLFEQAQAQWASDKLMKPAGDNAYETYHEILEMAPNNAQAKAGLLKMAEHYQHLARVAQKKGNLEESFHMIQQGLQVMPTHRGLQAYEQSLRQQIAQQQQALARAAQVKQLLSQAAQHLAMSQLEAAYATYQEVFAIEPDNQSARAKVQQVAEKYVQLARTQKGSLSSRLSFINKGLALFPNHRGLLALKQALNDEKLARQRELEAKRARQRELEAKRARQRELEAKRARQRELEAKRARQRALEAKRARQRELEAKRAQQRQIEKLLRKAEIQLKALRLTTPSGNNAYETYQNILSMAPDNGQAQAGLRKIADQYEQLAHIKRDDLRKNLALIEKGLKILPTHAGLKALRQTLIQKMQRVQPRPNSLGEGREGISRPRVIIHPHPNSQETADKSKPRVTAQPRSNPVPQRSTLPPQATSSLPPRRIVVVHPRPKLLPQERRDTPPPQEKPPAADSTVQNLLALARQHFEAAQFEAAIQTYRNVLRIAPGNVQAITGLQQMAYHYEQLARFQNKQGHLQKGLSLVKKGLAAYSTQSLLALQGEIIRRLNEKTLPDAEPPRLIFTPSF